MSASPEDVARIAKVVVLQMRDDGAALDVDEIVEGVACAYQHQLAPELLQRLRVYVARWVEYCERQRREGTVPPRPASGPPLR